MPGMTLTEAQSIMKLDYLPVVRDQIPTKTPYLNLVQKGTEDVVGTKAVFGVRTGRNLGVGARAAGGALPAAGSNTYKTVNVETKNIYARIAIQGKVFKAATTNRGAFLNVVENELKGAVEALQWWINGALMNVPSGVIATLSSSGGASTTQTISSSNASAKTRWIQKGMLIDIYASDLTTLRSAGRTVSSVDKTAGTFVIDQAVNVSANDVVVRAGSLNNEITGLKHVLTADNTLYDIDRSQAANKFFNPQVLANSGNNRSISEVLIQTGIDTAEVEAGGTISLMVSDHGVRRAYQDVLSALKRYVEPKRLSGGYTALDYNGIDWVADADFQANALALLDMSTFKLHTMIPELWDWGSEDNMILRAVAGYDEYEAFMAGYFEFACDTPAKNVIIKDLTEK